MSSCGVGLAVFGWLVTRPAGRSLVGEKCARCRDPIALEYQADICPQRSAGVHARCLEKHMTAAHATRDPEGPYR